MPRRAKKKVPRELTTEQRDRLRILEAEETVKPISWFRHDADAHDDPAVAELLMEPDGHALYGLYWVLIERMAARDGHTYKLDSERDWQILTRDLMLSYRSEEDVELAKRFIETLVGLGLLNPAAYEEHYIESIRLFRNCQDVGLGRANKRLQGEITAQQRWGEKKKGEGDGA